MSIPEIGTWFEFVGAELVENSNMRPLSDWENGDKLQVVAHVNMQGEVNPLYWNSRDLSSSTVREDLLEIIPATKPQPKPWSGPEDGLPPVGETCERRFDDLEDSSWQQITVIAYGNRKVFYSDKNGDEWSHHTSELEFRAIKTQEQIARDQRESAIRELMDIAQVDCRVTAARLVDAGFKREVV